MANESTVNVAEMRAAAAQLDQLIAGVRKQRDDVTAALKVVIRDAGTNTENRQPSGIYEPVIEALKGACKHIDTQLGNLENRLIHQAATLRRFSDQTDEGESTAARGFNDMDVV